MCLKLDPRRMKMNRMHCAFFGALALVLVGFFCSLFSVQQEVQDSNKSRAKQKWVKLQAVPQVNSPDLDALSNQSTSANKPLSFEEGLAKFKGKQNEFKKRRAERILKYPGSLELSLSVQNSKRDPEYVSYLREKGFDEEKIAEIIQLVHDRNQLREMREAELISNMQNEPVNQKEQKEKVAEAVRPFEEKISAILESKENRDDFDQWEETTSYRDSATRFADSLGATFDPNVMRQMAKALERLQSVKNQPANMMNSARSQQVQRQAITDQLQGVLPPTQLEQFIQFATKPSVNGGTKVIIAE